MPAGVLTNKIQPLLHHLSQAVAPIALLYDHLLSCKCLIPSHHKSISYPKFPHQKSQHHSHVCSDHHHRPSHRSKHVS